MQELVQHLCRIIADRWQAQPQMPAADLATAVLAQIAGDEPLQKLLDDTKARIVQNNSGDARGYQVRVEGGVVYVGNEKVFNISGDNVAGDKVTGDKVSGDKYVYNINLILKQLDLPVGIPHNIINRYGSAHFVGRDDELQELDRLLQASKRVAVTAVQGMGGVGKTELALQYALAQERAKTHLGGICWLRGREDVGGQIEVFAQTQLGIVVPEELKNRDLSERVAYYWRRWREGEVLVVVDDVLDYEAIADYLPPVETRFKVLLTTRLELGSGIQRLALGVLDPAAALELLRGLIGAGRVDGELADAESLCEWLGYLPLGIELVGRYLARNRTLTLAKMQERLNQKRLVARGLIKSTLDVAMTAAHESLAAAFEVSWEDLGNDAVFAAPVREYARQLGALLSLFAVAPIVWKWVVDCLPEWDDEDLEAARDYGLVGSHLLQVNGDSTYQLHPMVREFLAVKCDEMSPREGFERSFGTVILAEAQRSSENPEKSLIVECSLVIPHLQVFIQRSETARLVEETALGLSWFANLYQAMGRYEEAEPLYVRSLAIREEQLGTNHPDTATSLNNLALLYASMGRYTEAEPLYVRSLVIREEQLGANHPTTATSLNNLAALYRSMGRYTEAEPLYVRSLGIMEQQQLGANHPTTATSLNNLADLYRSMGRYTEAEPLCTRSLAIREEQLGANHPTTATSLNNLAYLYRLMGRYEEAEPLYVRSLGIMEQQLGANHPTTAISLNNLADLYRLMGRYTEAEPLYVRSLTISDKWLGSNHPDTSNSLNTLALLYHSMGRYVEAEPLYMRSLAIREEQLGANHSNTAASLNNLGGLYHSMGRYIEAEPLYVRSLAISEEQLGANHPDTSNSLNNLAGLYRSMGHYFKAEPL